MPLATRSLLSTWTPDTVTEAVTRAENGDLERAGALCMALLRDDRISGALSPRVEGLLGLPLVWEGEEPQGWYTLAPEPELARLLRGGLMLGRGFARVKADGAIETWSPEHFKCDRVTGQWSVRTREGETPIEFGTGEWIAYSPFGDIDPQLYGLWLTVSVPWLVKRYSLHDRARASEVFGSAMIVGKAPEGSTEEMRRRWLADLRALARNSRIVLPDVDYALELIEAQGQTWGIYQQAIEWSDQAITIAIAGQTVTVEGTKGFARGDVHERVARSLLRYTAESFATCLGTQYVKPVWGKDSFPKWVTASPDELIGEGEALSKLAAGIRDINAQLAVENKRVDIAALVKKYGIATAEVTAKVQAPSIALAPTDAVAVITVDEGRAAMGLPALPGDGSKLFAAFRAEQEAAAVTQAAPPAVDGIEAGAVQEEEPSEPPDAIKLAEDMTRLGVDACRHGRKNSCPMCRIRRRNEVTLGPDGAPRFPLVWEPVLASAVAVGAAAEEPLTEFRIFSYGGNLTNHRPTYLTRDRAASIVRAFSGRDIMIDLEHLSIDPEATNYDPNARGWARLECRDDGLYAIDVRWTDDGARRIRAGEQKYISPYYDVTPSGVIVRLTNLALTALPAMYFPPRVAA